VTFGSLHAGTRCRHLGRQQPVIRRFGSQSFDRAQSDVDRGFCQAGRFERRPLGLNRGFGKVGGECFSAPVLEGVKRLPVGPIITRMATCSLKSLAFLVVGGCVLTLTISPGCRRGSKKATDVTEILLAGDTHRDRILRGVYPGETAWRWTAPVFAFKLDPPPEGKQAYLEMDFTVPSELMERASAVTDIAKVNGAEAARTIYRTSGRYVFACKVPTLARRPAEVEFSVDRSFIDPATSRAMGLIVVSAGLKEYEQTAEVRQAEVAKSHDAYEEVLKQRDLQVPLSKQRDLMKIFHDLKIWESLRFHNVRIIKNPLDLWMLQQIAYEVQPDFVVETGTWYGGSALYWAHTLNGMGLENARVLTVDVQDFTSRGASSHALWKKYIQFFHGSSTDPAIVSSIAQRVKGSRVIVNLDSDHSMTHVLQELRMYASMVSAGSYIAVEDTHIDGIPTDPGHGPGPMAAVRKFLAEGGSKDFEQDFTREAMVMTSYPGGWLRRK
jgi:cephalosporin hydroxylase